MPDLIKCKYCGVILLPGSEVKCPRCKRPVVSPQVPGPQETPPRSPQEAERASPPHDLMPQPDGTPVDTQEPAVPPQAAQGSDDGCVCSMPARFPEVRRALFWYLAGFLLYAQGVARYVIEQPATAHRYGLTAQAAAGDQMGAVVLMALGVLFAIWVIAIFQWDKATLLGWGCSLVLGLSGVLLNVGVFAWNMDIASYGNAAWLLFSILLLAVLNTGGILRFIRSVNGLCPSCRKQPLPRGEGPGRGSWRCDACGKTIYWD